MRKLTKVEVFEQIRRAHFGLERTPIRELSRTFNVHRRTVRQALAAAVPPQRKEAVRYAPSLGPFKSTIDEWLEIDATMPKKQRHTARRIFQRLVEEFGADVSESSVRRYVAEVKHRTTMTPVERVTISQVHPLGVEAEVDFGEFSFFLNGVLIKA
jgi:transposase